VATLAPEAGVNPTPRVLFITGEYPPRIGGVGDHVVRLAAAIAARGWGCHVATESRSANDPAAGVHAVASGLPLQAVIDTLRVVRRVRPDVVHLHYQAGAFARPGELMGLARLLPSLVSTSRLAVTFHDLHQPYLFPKAGRLREAMVRSLGRGADVAIYVDEVDRRRAVAEGYGEENAHWIPAGPTIEPPAYSGGRRAARAVLDLESDAFIVGFFGFRQRSKGIEVLAHAMRRPELAGPRMRLVLIGAAGPATNARRAEPPVPPSTFDGMRLVDTGERRPEVISRWLAACDVVALPFLDGLSARRGSFMNAVAHGVPVVTTAPPVEGTVDVGADEVAFVAPDDAAGLAAALAEIRGDSRRRRQLAQGSRAIAARHTWAEIARRTLAAYGYPA